MLTLLAGAVALATSAVWYGPTPVSFPVSIQGNPYDPDENDARVRFKGSALAGGQVAYYEGGAWHANLVTRTPGRYQVSLTVNGKPVGTAKTIAIEKQIKDGFIRVGGPHGFQFDSGKLYWPLGHDLGWQSGNGFPDLTDFLKTMGKNGINWSRIWACTWDGKNPWWPNDGTKLEIGMFWPKALARWDAIVKAAEEGGVHFQFVLFHHGQWSSSTDPNWKDNPWNTANGGFLSNPADFFTNPRAKKLARAWLRYAVARWGHSPAIMSWELFNEVQWTNAVKDNRQAEVGAWHDEMARYVRSLDPVRHLVTTSSDLSLPIWREMDYWQPHGYPARVAPMVLGTVSPDKRPLFYGEIGPGQLDGSKGVQVLACRDGIWSGLFALQSGSAEYWTWDYVPRDNLHTEYKEARAILDESKVLAERNLKAVRADIDSGVGGDLMLRPGASWEATRQFDYNLPEDGSTGMGKFSAFFQGKGHPEMRREPVRFHFRAPKAGVARIGVSGISSTGGELTATVNGAIAGHKSWGAGSKLPGLDVLEVPFPAGQVTLQLDNAGSDWVQIDSIAIPGIAPLASATTIANLKFAMLRLERSSTGGSVSIRLGGLPLADGAYQGILTDLDSGNRQALTLRFRNGRATNRTDLKSGDAIVWLQERGTVR